MLAAVVEAVAELLDDAPGEVVACGLDHQGESVLAWDAESGEPLSPIVVWQDKRSQEVLDRLADREDEVKAASGLPFDPYFSAAKLAWLLEHDEAVGRARDAGTLRMGTVDSFLCDRLGAGFATDPSTASRTQLQRLDTPGFDPAPLRDLRRAARGAARGARHGRRPRARSATRAGRSSCRSAAQTVDQQAALAGAGCVVPGRVKATYGTGVFVLAHVGDEVPGAGRRPAPHGRLAHRRPDGVRARRRRVRGRGDARVDVPGARARRRPAALGALARRPTTRAAARVLPALAGIGAPWWRPDARAVMAGLNGGTTARAGRPRRARGDRLAGRRRRRGDPRDASTSTACAWTAGSRTSR